MTLIKDLISLPEHVHRGDFVLRLTEGVEKPTETLRDYVVTPQLVECFDDALRFINDAGGWGCPDLASVVALHTGWTESRRFLLVPYHMIGAQSMESAILGHYVEHVRRLHPDAPLPGVFRAEGLFAD